MSPGVAPEKDVCRWKWEVGCVTYQLDRNILNIRFSNDLWKMTSVKKAENMSKHVRASAAKNGKFAARRLVEDGIYSKASQSITCGKRGE
jgi:hypothetical protein